MALLHRNTTSGLLSNAEKKVAAGPEVEPAAEGGEAAVVPKDKDAKDEKYLTCARYCEKQAVLEKMNAETGVPGSGQCEADEAKKHGNTCQSICKYIGDEEVVDPADKPAMPSFDCAVDKCGCEMQGKPKVVMNFVKSEEKDGKMVLEFQKKKTADSVKIEDVDPTAKIGEIYKRIREHVQGSKIIIKVNDKKIKSDETKPVAVIFSAAAAGGGGAAGDSSQDPKAEGAVTPNMPPAAPGQESAAQGQKPGAAETS